MICQSAHIFVSLDLYYPFYQKLDKVTNNADYLQQYSMISSHNFNLFLPVLCTHDMNSSYSRDKEPLSLCCLTLHQRTLC